MNPFDCRIELRNRSTFEVFDLAVSAIRAWSVPLAWLSLAWLLPWAVLSLFVAWLSGQPLVVLCGLLLLARVVQAPYMLLTSQLLFTEAPSTRSVLRATVVHLPAIFGLWLASVAQILLSGCLFVIPWLFFYPWTLFLGETLLAERLPFGEGLVRATYLSRQEPTKAMFGATLILVSGSWVVLATELLGQGMMSYVLQAGSPFGELSNGDTTPFVLMGVLLAQPLIAVFRLLLYVDVRTTLEAWDLHIAFRAARAEA